MRRILLIFVLLAVFLVSLAVRAEEELGIDYYLEIGDKSFASGNYEKAVANFYNVYLKSDTGSEGKETAQYYIGKSLVNLGLTYAGSEFLYEIVKSGSNIDRITDALYILQNLIENSPHDYDLIKADLIFNMEYSFLPGDLLDFANYYKGEVNFRKRLYKWANKRFSLISKKSFYNKKVKYLRGIQILALGKIDPAIEIFESIIEDDFQDFNIKNKARETVARLFYEQKKYKEAYELLMKIDAPPLKQTSVFLAKAWCLFFMKRYQESLGVINSLFAPLAKERYFYPEKYILKALIHRAICQFDEAKRTVVDFQNEYGPAIETILNREDPFKNDVLKNAAMWNTEVKDKTQFISQLKSEKEKALSIGSGWDSTGFRKFSEKIYDLKIDEITKLIENEMLDRFKEVSNQLLDYYEQIRLVEYELSLDELSRLKKPPIDVEKVEKIPLVFENKIYWPFNGEFWTDELLFYKHLITNKCGQRS